MRVLDLCLSQCWACTQEALAVILAIAARDDVPTWAIEATKGRPLDNTRSVTYRDGVATIPINGALVRHGDLFSDVSGAVSINALAADFTAALHDTSVRGILFSIDSPGGEVNGTAEFSDMVYAARGTKPIEAYISHLGCSAAYWIASACDAISCDSTAQVGSIGVIAAVPNPEKDSKRELQFVSSQSPGKRPDPTTESGRTQIQTRVDALADVFVAAVARNRGVETETVLTAYGAGGVLVGQGAVAAGLADRVGSYEDTLARLAQAGRTAPTSGGGSLPPRRQPATGAQTGGDAHAEEDQEMPDEKKFADDTRVAEMQRQMEHMQRQQAEAQARYDTMAAQNAVMHAQHAELQGRLRQSAATAFVEGLVRDGRALPYEADAIAPLYIRAATDDDTYGVAAGDISRVTQLTTAYQARAPHGLFTERVGGGFSAPQHGIAVPAGVDGGAASDLAALDKENEAYVARMNGKRGRAHE